MPNYDKDMAEERIQIKNDKEKIYEDDKKKRDAAPKAYPEKGPKKKDCYGPKTFEGGAHRGEMRHDKEGNHLGPKKHVSGHDDGPKMTSNPLSYRSSMARHWQASNSRFDMPIIHDEAGRAGEGNM